MPLTTKQKFSLIFSLYVSVFIIFTGAVFFLILHTLLTYQIQKDASMEASNVIKNHITVDKDTVLIVKDKAGDSLSSEVIEANVSVLLLDNNLRVIKGYGLLDLYNQGDEQSVKIISKMAGDAQKLLKQYTKTVPWRGQDMSVYVAPIKNSGKSYGVVVAAKSLTQTQTFEKIILAVLFSLTITSAVASLFLTRLLVGKIFEPIRKLTEVISGTSLDKLDKTLLIPGSKSDELVILGDKFNEMMIRLNSMSQQQKEFISNASHELKTPLSRAISSLDLSKPSNKPDEELHKDVKGDLFEINNLLEKLMFLSRLRPGMILPSDKLSVNKLIAETAETFTGSGRNIVTDLDRDAIIFIPKEYAKVLLSNILSNALKYSQVNCEVYLQTKLLNGNVILTVSDQGNGITKSDLRRIEERFYRGASERKISGHGIGLSIVRRIVDLYKINFKINSEPQKGTEVTLEFPVYQWSA